MDAEKSFGVARFPEIAQELQNLAQADAAYIGRQRELAARQQSVEDSMLGRATNSFIKGGVTAEGVIDRALSDPRKWQLVGAVRRTEGASPALRWHVWDRAMNGDAAGITKFIVDNGKSLRLLFGQGTCATSATSSPHAACSSASRTRPAPLQGAAPARDVERVIGQGLPQLGNRIFALKSAGSKRNIC